MSASMKYAKTHEWVSLEGTVAKVGITEFAVAEIKDIVYVDLPAAGIAVKAGEPFGAIETVKAAFDLYAPVSGTIKASNAALTGSPETVSKDPLGAGWMVEIAVADAASAASELGALLDKSGYDTHCKEHAH